MNVYILIRKGIYRHEILGAFADLAVAKVSGRLALEAEPDDHHSVEVVETTLGEYVPVEFLPQEDLCWSRGGNSKDRVVWWLRRRKKRGQDVNDYEMSM